MLLHLSDLSVETFPLGASADMSAARRSAVRKTPFMTVDLSAPKKQLQRCTKCILPETMPFIEFDEQGVCSYCRRHQKIAYQGPEKLEELVEKYRSKRGQLDCLVLFSGGRDSSYTLHYVKKVLGMNPIAYSYDWGMMTDLGRRNQARMCGSLGIEHILVSADIKQKRNYIRKNIQAWLRRPDLGMVPIFMAGDKQYFFYANKIMKETGIKLAIMGDNPLEKSRFKQGFCGIDEGHRKVYDLPLWQKFQMAAYYGKQYFCNPAYINSSVLDTLFAFFSTYFTPHNYLDMFNYILWDEDEINSTLINTYDWEIAPDTSTTWRIGDGTAAFYNYIYYTIAGFTENDAFRSNQIREGLITREDALRLVEEENKPRFESLNWYAQTIGFNLDEALAIINGVPKLYEEQA